MAEEVAEAPSMTLFQKLFMMVSGARTKSTALEKSSIMRKDTMKAIGYEARKRVMECMSSKTRPSILDSGKTTWQMARALLAFTMATNT